MLLRRENAVLKNSLHSALSNLWQARTTFVERRKTSTRCYCDSLSKLSPTAKNYITDILHNASKKRPTWSLQSCTLATGVYHYSPRTARYLRSVGLLLPCKSTVRSYVGGCLRTAGPCPKILKSLELVSFTLPPSMRHVTISIDGMKISPSIRYEEHLDRIGGLEDYGSGGRSDKLADELKAVWLRSIESKHKQVSKTFIKSLTKCIYY